MDASEAVSSRAHPSPFADAIRIDGVEPATSPGTRWAESDVSIAYVAHRDVLLGRMVRATGDLDVAEDILQEAYLRLCVAAARGNVPDNVGGWLHRVAMNLLVDRARRQRPPVSSLASDLDPETGPEERAIERERADALRSVLDQMPADIRRALVMEGAGYQPHEIGPAVGRSGPATRTLLCRARRWARELLLAQGQEAERIC